MATSVFMLAECLLRFRDFVANAGEDTAKIPREDYSELLARFRSTDPASSGKGSFWEAELASSTREGPGVVEVFEAKAMVVAAMKTQRVKVIDSPLPPGIWGRTDMEPQFITAPEHMAVRDELMQREPLFHRPEFGRTRADFEKMTAPEFREVGASGRRFSRQFVLDTLEERYETPTEDVWEVGDFHCLEIAADNYLVTYTLIQHTRVTRRATIWRRTAKGWQIVYHQGTVVGPS